METNCDFTLVIRLIDEFLVETGTQSLLDADKVRDHLLDLRSVVAVMAVPEPEVVGAD